MKKYELAYEQPFEYDDDSPSGIGDHGVGYSSSQHIFAAENDEDVKRAVREFLGEGGLQFGWHIGSPEPGLYPRKFVSLHEVTDPREVRMGA